MEESKLQLVPSFRQLDIRQFWKPGGSDKALPTKKGISLNIYKWERLCDVMSLIREFIPKIDEEHICYLTRSNELELSGCKECYPFDQIEEDDEKQYEISSNQEGEIDIMTEML